MVLILHRVAGEPGVYLRGLGEEDRVLGVNLLPDTMVLYTSQEQFRDSNQPIEYLYLGKGSSSEAHEEHSNTKC